MDTLSGVVPDVCSCSALRQASRHMSRLYDEALGPVGLSLNQYSILAKAERSGPLSIQDLAALLVMDRSTVGHLLRPLVKRDLVTLETATDDRRSRVVRLTPTGEALMRQARPRWADAERRFGEVFGVNEAAGLRATLRRVVATDLSTAGDQ